MFDTIRQHEILRLIECHACREENRNTIVEFDESLYLQKDFLNYDKVLILKPDDYYNSLKIAKRPPSVDCLILINSDKLAYYELYLVELKDTNRKELVDYDEIVKKFETMINEFFKQFIDIFGLENYEKIEFYLVTSYLTRKNRSIFLDVYTRKPALLLFGKRVHIIPKPSPFKITTC